MTQANVQTEPGVGLSLIAAVACVLLLGLLFGGSLWVLAALVAATAIAVNRGLAGHWAGCVTAERVGGDAELRLGESVTVEIRLHNRTRLPVPWILAEDLIPPWTRAHSPPALEIEGDWANVLLLWPRQQRLLRYKITANRRGYFQIGPTVLETGDLMGFYRRYRAATPPQYITVLPRTVPMGDYEVASPRPVGEIRVCESVMEDPTRLRGIRQWQPGDPMRRVHWAATARTGTLHSKVYEPTSVAGATLVLDLHADTNPLRNEPVRTDLAIMAALAIATWLHDQGQPFGLVTNGRDAADRIRTEGWRGDHRVRNEAFASAEMNCRNDRLRPVVVEAGREATRLQRLRRLLARLERTDGLSMPQLLGEAQSQISNQTTLLAVMQQTTPEAAAALIGFARRGRSVAAVINTYEPSHFAEAASPLIAANIPVYPLHDERSIPELCRNVQLRMV